MRLFVLFIALLAGNHLVARESHVYMTFKVLDEYTEHQIDSAFVTVFHADSIFKTDTSFFFGLDGFYLPVNREYEFVIGKKGYVSKRGTLNTGVKHISDVPYRMEVVCFVGLFPSCHQGQYDFLKETPLISFSLDENGEQKWDMAQTKKMQQKIYDAHFNHLDENMKEQASTAFQEVITLLEDKQYEKADSLYLKKKDVLMHDEVYCGLVRKLHQNIRRTIRIIEEEKQYKKLKDAADKAFEEKQYDKAENLYSRMHKLRPKDWYPEDMLYEIEYAREEEKKK